MQPVGDFSSLAVLPAPQPFQLGMSRKPRPRAKGLFSVGRGSFDGISGKSEAARARVLSPQQATEQLPLTPQECSHPALTETKQPAGGVA